MNNDEILREAHKKQNRLADVAAMARVSRLIDDATGPVEPDPETNVTIPDGICEALSVELPTHKVPRRNARPVMDHFAEAPPVIPYYGIMAGAFKSLADAPSGYPGGDGARAFILNITIPTKLYHPPQANSVVFIDESPFRVLSWGPGTGRVLVHTAPLTASRLDRKIDPRDLMFLEGGEDPTIVGKFDAEMYGPDGHGGFAVLIKVPVFYTRDLEAEDVILVDGIQFEVKTVQHVPKQTRYWWIAVEPVYTSTPTPPKASRPISIAPGVSTSESLRDREAPVRNRRAELMAEIEKPREWPRSMQRYLTINRWPPSDVSLNVLRDFGMGS